MFCFVSLVLNLRESTKRKKKKESGGIGFRIVLLDGSLYFASLSFSAFASSQFFSSDHAPRTQENAECALPFIKSNNHTYTLRNSFSLNVM